MRRRYHLPPFDPSTAPHTDEVTAFDAYVVRECIGLLPVETFHFANSLVLQWYDKHTLSASQRHYLHAILERVTELRSPVASVVIEAALNNAAQLLEGGRTQ